MKRPQSTVPKLTCHRCKRLAQTGGRIEESLCTHLQRENQTSETRRHFQHVCSGGSTPHLKAQTYHRPEVTGLKTRGRLLSGATDPSLDTHSRALYPWLHQLRCS